MKAARCYVNYGGDELNIVSASDSAFHKLIYPWKAAVHSNFILAPDIVRQDQIYRGLMSCNLDTSAVRREIRLKHCFYRRPSSFQLPQREPIRTY